MRKELDLCVGSILAVVVETALVPPCVKHLLCVRTTKEEEGKQTDERSRSVVKVSRFRVPWIEIGI